MLIGSPAYRATHQFGAGIEEASINEASEITLVQCVIVGVRAPSVTVDGYQPINNALTSCLMNSSANLSADRDIVGFLLK
jgi:hypothetical protein